MGNSLHETSNLVKCIFLVLWPYRHQITYLISQSWTWFLFSLLRTSNRRRREFSNYSRKITGDTGVLLNLLLVHCHGREFKKKPKCEAQYFFFTAICRFASIPGQTGCTIWVWKGTHLFDLPWNLQRSGHPLMQPQLLQRMSAVVVEGEGHPNLPTLHEDTLINWPTCEFSAKEPV